MKCQVKKRVGNLPLHIYLKKPKIFEMLKSMPLMQNGSKVQV